jgi:hypothetical protein
MLEFNSTLTDEQRAPLTKLAEEANKKFPDSMQKKGKLLDDNIAYQINNVPSQLPQKVKDKFIDVMDDVRIIYGFAPIKKMDDSNFYFIVGVIFLLVLAIVAVYMVFFRKSPNTTAFGRRSRFGRR